MATCPNCRTEAEPTSRFCGACGCNLEQARSAERERVQAQPCEPARGQQQYTPPPAHTQTQQYQQPAYQQQAAAQQPPQYSQQQYDQYQQYQQYPSYQYGRAPKSAGIAAVLALVPGLFGIMGIGHMYVGKLTRGFIILAAGLILAAVTYITAFLGFASPAIWAITLICGIALLLLWIWQTYDAYRLANEYNNSIRRSGRPGW